jgi:hypothetical protein
MVMVVVYSLVCVYSLIGARERVMVVVHCLVCVYSCLGAREGKTWAAPRRSTASLITAAALKTNGRKISTFE